MSVITGERLTYGQDDLVPPDSPGAWGARLIVSQLGYVDVVHDRMGAAGDRRILDELNERFSMLQMREMISNRLITGIMQTRTAAEIVLFSDDVIEVHANTNGSGGYCYVTAWLKP